MLIKISLELRFIKYLPPPVPALTASPNSLPKAAPVANIGFTDPIGTGTESVMMNKNI